MIPHEPGQEQRARSGDPAQAPDLRAFALRFALGFLVLEAFVYLVLWHPAWFVPYAEWNARLAAGLLAPFFEVLEAKGAYLVTPTYSIHVRPGCDGYQASAVLLAGVLAFPARRAHKWIGALVGVASLMALNLLRIAALLWAGVHHPEHFKLMHLQVLPGVFVAAALLLLFSWALWARR